jgi:hypothetical protein
MHNNHPSEPISNEVEPSVTVHFYETLYSDLGLHCTRLLTSEGSWYPTIFVHRTPADLLESISTRQFSGRDKFPFRPTDYSIFTCDAYPEPGKVANYAYHHLLWGQDGTLRGYGDTQFCRKVKPAFYSIREDQVEIRVTEPEYAGNYLYAAITKDLTLAIQPQLLSSFLRHFLHTGSRGGSMNPLAMIAPQLSSFYLSMGDQDYCLSPEINERMHEYPWLNIRPQAPRASSRLRSLWTAVAAG